MPVSEDDRPSAGRVFAAFLAAAFASVTLFMSWVMGSQETVEGVLGIAVFAYLFGIPIALLHIVLLATPIYLAIRPRWHVRWWSSALAGFAVAAFPIGLLNMFSADDGYDWETPLQTGVLGLVGGLTFWVLVRERSRATPINAAEIFN